MMRWRTKKEPVAAERPWDVPYDGRASEADIFHAFRLLLGRHPNREEIAGHMGAAGRPLADVVRVYLDSREFALRGLRPAEVGGAVVCVDTGEGFSIHVQPADIAVGEGIAGGYAHEPHVTEAMRRRLRPGMRVIDIGANVGWFTLLAASVVGEGGEVIAVEPDRTNVALIEASRRINGFENILLLPVAAGRTHGAVAMFRSYSNGSTLPLERVDPLTASVVPQVRLDDVIDATRGPIGLIKADVEGAEPMALAGLERVFGRDRPVVISEFAPTMMLGTSGVDGRAFIGGLMAKGYAVAVIGHDGVERACDDADAALRAHADGGVDHIDIVCEPL